MITKFGEPGLSMSENMPPHGQHRWWRGATIYQIYPRSFLDSNGDGIGDLRGIIAGLDHIASLGVDGIWLSPFFTSPMDDFGYDVADYCDVDRVFGTLADFDALVERAHQLDLKLIIDQVYSHTSDRHGWFQDSRESAATSKSDWYVWADAKPDGSPPNNWQSVFGGPAWTWDGRRGQYYLHNFLASQPDLNVHHQPVQNALLDVARFWLNRGVDGFRFDAINFSMHDQELRDNPPAKKTGTRPTRPFDFQEHRYNQSHPDIPKFLQRIRAVMDEYDAIYSVAEVVGNSPLDEMKAFTAQEKHLHTAYNFDFLYADRLTASTIKSSLSAWEGAPGEGWPAWAFSNHDAPRAVSRWASDDDRKRAATCYALLLTALRGNIFIYQGEELGLPQGRVDFKDLQDPEAIRNWPHTLGRDGARTPMAWRSQTHEAHAGFTSAQPWLPVDPRHHGLAIDAQNSDPASTLNQIRAFLAYRKTSPTLRLGTLKFVDGSNDQILIFTRYYQDTNLLCLFNLGPTALLIDNLQPSLFRPVLASGFDELPSQLPKSLPAYGGVIAKNN